MNRPLLDHPSVSRHRARRVPNRRVNCRVKGVIMGVVRQIASNTTQPENAMPFYETIIAIPEVSFTKSPDMPIVTAGMPLQVDILGGKQTIMNYIMTPIQKSLATAFREK